MRLKPVVRGTHDAETIEENGVVSNAALMSRERSRVAILLSAAW